MNNNTGKFTPVIGKNVIENLTIGMYDDPRFVYREYVQNAADQIDIAKRQNLYQSDNEACIYIQIDKDAKTVIIEDNATGIEQKNVLPLLGNIAQSTKNKYEDKGFRGIGRLGGLGYCNKLTFETSFYGEEVKSIMVWDAKLLKKNINDDSIKIDAAELISIITDYSFQSEEKEEHYFKVILERVENEELLDVEKVRDYLSMVAPIPFASHFTHRSKIYGEANKLNITIDEYKILFNGEQLFKGYKNSIYNKENQIDNEREIIDVEFFYDYYHDFLFYWGWYGVSPKMQQIPDLNKEKRIRLRKDNIQIGLENRLDFLHKEPRGSEYFVGEVYAVDRELIPNARRDFFIDNDVYLTLISKLRDFFYKKLNPLYRDFATKNSALTEIQEFETLQERVKDNSIGNSDKQKLEEEILKKEEKVEKAKKNLQKLSSKYKGQTLGDIIKDVGFDFDKPEKVDNTPKKTNIPIETKFSQPPIIQEKSLSLQETTLLKKVYSVIRLNLIRETAEELIQKIEEDLKK
jgi:molecular chaperone HtpG